MLIRPNPEASGFGYSSGVGPVARCVSELLGLDSNAAYGRNQEGRVAQHFLFFVAVPQA